MNFNIIKLIIALTCTLMFSGCFAQSGQWYDYGDGKINLSKVDHIRPLIRSTLTLPDDPTDEMFAQFNESLNEINVKKYRNILTTKDILASDFYAIQVETYVMFDSFKLKIYESDLYIKLPELYRVNAHMIKQMRANNVPNESIEKLQNESKKLNSAGVDRTAFIKLLKDSSFNMDSAWVQNTLIDLGLGEKGLLFVDKYKNSVKRKASEADVDRLREKLSESLKRYKEIPAK